MKMKIRKLPHATFLASPCYATEAAAGFDIRAATQKALVIEPGARAMVPTGLVFAIPAGYEAQVRPRSGFAAKQGVTVLNSPGTIDADYKGEVKVILVNHGHEPVTIERGDRIAQVVVAPVTMVEIDYGEHEGDEDFEEAAGGRSSAGFGSTGRQ